MGIIITDELMDFHALEYRRKLEIGEVKNMNFTDYLDVMVHMDNLRLGLKDGYFSKLEEKYLKGDKSYGKEEK